MSITPLQMSEARYLQYLDDDIGLCRYCGAERESCEPDAQRYPCPDCKRDGVYGVEELLARGEVEIV